MSKGERVRSAKAKRDFVRRERVCIGRARHRFVTEERPR